jgi:hypothetical protein
MNFVTLSHIFVFCVFFPLCFSRRDCQRVLAQLTCKCVSNMWYETRDGVHFMQGLVLAWYVVTLLVSNGSRISTVQAL